MSSSVLKGALLAIGLVPFALAACGGDQVSHPADNGPAARPAAALAPVASAKAGPEYNESDFVENDRNRDPFRTYVSLFVEGQKKTFDAQRKVLLSQYSLEELKLVAIVQGGDYPRAMVVDPRGKGSVLKRGDFVGRAETVHTGGTNGTDYQVNWRVDRVRDGDVVFIREDQAQPNIAPATRVVPLHPEATTNDQDQNDDSKL
jgi:type IV pilus assembly protein PilP